MQQKPPRKKAGRNSRLRGALVLGISVILLVAITIVALNGFGRGFMVRYMKPWGEAIRLGLDLRGGVYTVYQATDNGEGNFDSQLDVTIKVLMNRLTAQNFTEATVTKQGNDRIRIEIPDVSDPDEILEIIGTPAHLEFVDSEGNVLMEGKDVKSASAQYIQSSGSPVVAFELTDEGRELFAAATAANLGKTITITLDGETISAPTVNSVINQGSGYIEGQGMTIDDAQNLAMLIQSGALPLELTQLEVSAISATLGVEALDRALLAGVIGVALVMLFMLFRYRLSGLAADLALWTYILLVVFILALTGVQLTLPGIAGIVLGIGMAVDANVIIFERFKDEARLGRPLNSAVKMGFHNALSAILDSNVTTIIAALVLMVFGTGPIKGFAMTLVISVGASMVTALFVTRMFLNALIDLNIKNTKLFIS